jgi:hypothetical protein
MCTKYTAALTTLLILGIASFAQAQQSSSDTTRPDRDNAQDQRALATDTMKLHLDIAHLDSLRALQHQDQTQARADEKQLDSLKAVIKRDRQATPRDSAALAQDQAQLMTLRKKLDTELDRARRERTQVEVAQKAVRRESQAAIKAHQDIKEDKAVSQKPDRDRARDRDQQALATDTMKLRLDETRLDSARALLNEDQTQARGDEKQLDSLKAVLKHDTQTGNTAAIAKDKAAVTALRNKLDTELDRARREEGQVDLAQKAVRRETHAAVEAHQDIKEDRPRSQEHSGAAKRH